MPAPSKLKNQPADEQPKKPRGPKPPTPPIGADQLYCSPDQAALVLNVSRSTLYNTLLPKLSARKIGSLTRIEVAGLHRFMAAAPIIAEVGQRGTRGRPRRVGDKAASKAAITRRAA